MANSYKEYASKEYVDENYASKEYVQENIIFKNIDIKMPTNASWSSIAYGDGKFVAVASSSSIAAYSEDGFTWIKTTMPTTGPWDTLVYGNGKFIALMSGYDTAAYSEDGINWTKITIPFSTNFNSLVYGGGKFLARATTGGITAYSEDGIRWTEGTIPFTGGAINYVNGKFITMNFNNLAYSEDGINWTQTTISVSAGWNSIAYGNGKFVAVAGGWVDTAAYSEDGINWTQTVMPNSIPWISVVYGGGKFVAVQNAKTAAYSEDGINWTQTAMLYSNWKKIIYSNDNFFAISGIGGTNVYVYSEDGINWATNLTKFETLAGANITEDVKEAIVSSDERIVWNAKANSTHTHTSDDLILTDTATGTKYRLYATNGKLTMVADGEEVPTVFENGEEMTF